jgi:hypothetical protein
VRTRTTSAATSSRLLFSFGIKSRWKWILQQPLLPPKPPGHVASLKAIETTTCLHYVSDMSANTQKTITGRELRRSTPEERLMPGESIIVRTQDGKVFELKRVDIRAKSSLKGLDQLLEDILHPGKPARTNLARIIIEDRE